MAKIRGTPPPPPPPAPLTPAPTTEFRQDSKRQGKRGKDMAKLRVVIESLCSRVPLAAKHRDHSLTGNRKGGRECHVEPDWLLIYRVDEKKSELILGPTGTHADLFASPQNPGKSPSCRFRATRLQKLLPSSTAV
ncbi:MAG: hypothetical protein NVSMB9_22890 [Isosphaeraceae bacterium]